MQFDLRFMSDHTLKTAYGAGTVWRKILVALKPWFFFFFCGLPLFMYLFMFAYFHLYMCTHTQVETALDVSYSP